MTSLQDAARNAIKLLEELRGISYLKYEHTAIENSAKELRTALAQHREQQPVCHGCGIPAGDVHMSTCKSGKWPSRVSNGDTAAPAPQAQQGEPVAWLKEWVSVGYEGKETPLVRIDATPGCERWLERLNPRITPLIKAAPAPQAQPVAQPLTDKRIS